MSSLNSNFNLYLNLNLNSVLVLLLILPASSYTPYCYLLSAVLLGKKSGCFFKLAKIVFGPWLIGGPESSYPTTTGGRLVRKSSGPSHSTTTTGAATQ